jgi:ubiquinone/menaquinone biosynthesis C-methylase UbiE
MRAGAQQAAESRPPLRYRPHVPTEPTEASNDAAAPNEAQAALWNDVLVETFTRFRRVIVDGEAAHSDLALRRHPPVVGERVLDVGCGFGETSVQLGRAVGPRGSVLGLDLSEPFLTTAREDARAAGLQNVTFRRADAQVERFASEFDLAFSRFGTMFFQDPVVAFANLRDAVRPGGRLLMIVWRRPDENQWAVLPKKIVLEHLPRAPERTGGAAVRPWPAAGPFALSRPDVVRAILTEAGWKQIALEPVDTEMTVGQTIEEALGHGLAFGPAGELVREAKEKGAAKRSAIEHDLAKALRPYFTPRGVLLRAASWCVTAAR